MDFCIIIFVMACEGCMQGGPIGGTGAQGHQRGLPGKHLSFDSVNKHVPGKA